MTALGLLLLVVVTMVFAGMVVASAMLTAVGETLGRGLQDLETRGLTIRGNAAEEWAALRSDTALAPPSRRLALRGATSSRRSAEC